MDGGVQRGGRSRGRVLVFVVAHTKKLRTLFLGMEISRRLFKVCTGMYTNRFNR